MIAFLTALAVFAPLAKIFNPSTRTGRQSGISTIIKPAHRGSGAPLTYFHPLWEGASIPANTWHFHRRLWERYEITLGPGEYSKLRAKAVLNKEGHFYTSDRARVHKIFLEGRSKPIYVLADDKSLISVLLPAHATRKKRQKAKASNKAVEAMLAKNQMGDDVVSEVGHLTISNP